jgi:NADH-quinone oxidoreductase subunit L
VLAYSTVSQLGYMVLALGVGAYWVAVFHLYTHAFFKALLFLGSGSVIHALSGEQDMRRMGGLKDRIPLTFRTMLIGSLAIAGIPGLAGFFSKDEILWQTFSAPSGSKALWAVGFVTAGMTAFYMFRMMYLTFYGASRTAPETAAKVHESPPSMTLPLAVLAAGSVAAGWIGVPKLWSVFPDSFRAFEHWLEPALAAAPHAAETGHDAGAEWLLMLLSVGVAVAGILAARYFYLSKPEIPKSIASSAGPLTRALENKWYLDQVYGFLFVDGLGKTGGRLMGAFDRNVIDGGVNAAGWLTRLTSSLSIWWDTWIIDGAVRLSSFGVKVASYPVRILQSGQLQTYALWAIGGMILFFGFYMTSHK